MTESTQQARLCTIDGCSKPEGKAGICWMHRKRLSRAGMSYSDARDRAAYCRWPECDRLHTESGLCKRHLRESHAASSLPPLDLRRPERKPEPPTRRRPRTPAEKLVKTGWTVTEAGCWEWRGFCAQPGGYGRVGYKLAHRVSYELHRGPIPEGHFVCHRCDNPPCINPDHLFLGTPAENTADAVSKKRMAWGERAGAAKLTAGAVREIRALHAEGARPTQLAARYGVTHSAINFIIRRRTWAHLED